MIAPLVRCFSPQNPKDFIQLKNIRLYKKIIPYSGATAIGNSVTAALQIVRLTLYQSQYS
jgi:hypothetical protein